jgi:hypothetical protein
MIDNVLLLLGVALIIGIVYVAIRAINKRKEAEEQRKKAEAEWILQRARDKVSQRLKVELRNREMMKHAVENTKDVPKPSVTATPAPTVSYAPSPTQSVQSSNLLSDIADIAMIANTVHHWNDNKPHVSNTDNPIDFPKEERSVSVSKSESSYGWGDSDTSSPKSSWSSSSSSSDSWSSSSSDSSPSSDW